MTEVDDGKREHVARALLEASPYVHGDWEGHGPITQRRLLEMADASVAAAESYDTSHGTQVPLSVEDMRNIAEIVRLNDEALDFDSDGAKSSEGGIDVTLDYGYWLDRRDPPRVRVSIYAYVLGPHRGHDFDSTQEALDAMRAWHKEHMEADYDD